MTTSRQSIALWAGAAAMALALIVTCDAAAQAPPPLPPQGLELPRPGGTLREAQPGFEPPAQGPRLELPTPAPSEEAPLSDRPIIFLRGVTITGSTIFTEEDFRPLVAPYVDRRVSTEDLQALRRALTRFYVDRGYINSGAVLFDQKVEGGIVTYTIVEGHLSEIEIAGNDHLEARYVRDRIELRAGRPLNVNDLRDGIALLIEDPLIERLDATLGPGTGPGESELAVRLQEADRFTMRTWFANDGAPSVGEYRGRALLTARDLTGWGEISTVDIAKSASLTEITGRLQVPVTPWDTMLSVAVSDNGSTVIEAPFDDIDIESETRDYEIALSHPVYRAPGRRLDVEAAFVHRRGKTFLLGAPFSFSPGAVDGESIVSAFRLSQSWLDRRRDQVIAVRLTFSLGVDLLDATTHAGDVPDGRFFSWLGEFHVARRVPQWDGEAIFRVTAQLTPDRLLSLEKFAIGGVETVRGYRKNTLVRDNGWAATVEARVPVATLPLPKLSGGARDGSIDLAPFIDAGQSWSTGVDDPAPSVIWSVGIGLLWEISDAVRTSIYVAQRLRDVAEPEDKALQDMGVHFSLSADF